MAQNPLPDDLPSPHDLHITYLPDALHYTQSVFHLTRQEPPNSTNRRRVHGYQVLIWEYLKQKVQENEENGNDSPLH